MTKIHDFKNWLLKSFPGSEFDSEAITYQPILDGTCGWAANGLMHMLNRAVCLMEDDEQYLEIGTYGGRSLIGALRNNNKFAQVIDPFSNTAPGVESSWIEAINRFGVASQITLHKEFSERFSGDLPPIGVFFYDGSHEAGFTLEGLKAFERYLAPRAIVVVDDYIIPGGGNQLPYPGYFTCPFPVRNDVDRWLAENDNYKLIAITPWTFRQAVMIYEKN